MASIPFFSPWKKKECECLCMHTHTHTHTRRQAHSSTMLCKVTVSTLKLGCVKWVLARVPERLHHRGCTTFVIRCLEQYKATNHQIITCHSHCFWLNRFLLSLPLSLSLSKLQPICKCSLPQGQIWKSEEQHNLSKCGRKWGNQAPC